MLSPGTLGALAGAGAFLSWGTLVLYWHALKHVDAFDILAHRILWSLVFMLPATLLTGRLPEVRAALRDRGAMLRIFLSALLIAGNWCMYIYAVTSGRVLEAGLGYYINPLVCVLLGCLLLRERMSRLQGMAIVLATTGVLFKLIAGGNMPWLSLGLACSFALYGFIRKTVRVEAAPGLFLETALLAPLAFARLLWEHAQGASAFTSTDMRTALLLAGSGVITAIPLLFFAYAARHVSLITLGLLQYLSPSITMVLGICVMGAEADSVTLITFACIWAALALYTWCGLRTFKRGTT